MRRLHILEYTKRTLASLLLTAGIAAAALGDDVFLQAQEAYRNGDAELLAEHLRALDGHVLAPYVQYWHLRLRIDTADEPEVQAFLARNENTLIADRLRADWLRELARRQAWSEFLNEFPRLTTEDVELTCYSLQARIALDDDTALAAARSQWFTGRVQPESCLPLFAAMFEHKLLGVEDVWQRVRLALEAGNRIVAKAAIEYLPQVQRPDPDLFDSIARRPQNYIKRNPLPVKSRAQRELTIYALYRAAQSWPQLASQKMRSIEKSLPKPERDYAWGQVAMVSAWKHHASSLAWYKRADESGLNDTQLAWKVRSALRAGDWESVVSAVDAMSPRSRMAPQWRYWKARALASLGRKPEANLLLAPLSNELNFYGQLAAEDLGAVLGPVAQTYTAGAREIEAIAANPGLQRALALYRNGMRYEGALEWQWTVAGFDDRQLNAAAALAFRNEWYERAIHTAERTVVLHDFGLRFPAPYREVMQQYAAQLDLDEAWIYGLIRQESRFVITARSSAGAAGLMQLMPATAKWVAQRLGLTDHHGDLVDGIDTNLSLGTYYLRHVLDSLDNSPVMASAGYNAGPRRASDWRAPEPLEGAVYAETIPFPETRDYVQKVMSNTMYYARLFRDTAPSLREWLGVIPARPPQRN
ncbi:MAG: transglycosylase SLT domain-containing protein [Burkholderiales bacterium]